MSKEFFVYILTNKLNSVLYIGVTNNLERRTFEHQLKQNKNGFAERYNCNKLVYYESTNNVNVALNREKQLKGYTRKKKIDLINSFNANWQDLFIV